MYVLDWFVKVPSGAQLREASTSPWKLMQSIRLQTEEKQRKRVKFDCRKPIF